MRVGTTFSLLDSQQLKAQLRLQPGDILKGRIVEDLGNGKWVMRTRGVNLVVESSIALEKGEILQAQVLQMGDPIRVRLVLSTDQAQVNLVSASEMLAELGFVVTEENISLLQTLIQLEWSPSLFSQLIPYMEILPGQSPMTVILAWLMGMPPHPHLLESLQTLTHPHVPLGQLLGDLEQALQQLSQQHFSQDLQQWLQDLRQWIPPSPQEGLAQWLRQLNVSYESQLTREGFVQENLKILLLEIRNYLRQLEGEGASRAAGLLEHVLHQLDAHAMMNQAQLQELAAFYFQIPYTLDGHTGTIEFKGESSEDDEGAFQISFIAHTVHLGKLKVMLMIQERSIRCDLLAENATACDFIQRHQDELRVSLNALQYRVERLKCTVAPPDAFLLELVQSVPALLDQWVALDMRV